MSVREGLAPDWSWRTEGRAGRPRRRRGTLSTGASPLEAGWGRAVTDQTQAFRPSPVRLLSAGSPEEDQCTFECLLYLWKISFPEYVCSLVRYGPDTLRPSQSFDSLGATFRSFQPKTFKVSAGLYITWKEENKVDWSGWDLKKFTPFYILYCTQFGILDLLYLSYCSLRRWSPTWRLWSTHWRRQCVSRTSQARKWRDTINLKLRSVI